MAQARRVRRAELDRDVAAVDGDRDGAVGRHEPEQVGPDGIGDGAPVRLVGGPGRCGCDRCGCDRVAAAGMGVGSSFMGGLPWLDAEARRTGSLPAPPPLVLTTAGHRSGRSGDGFGMDGLPVATGRRRAQSTMRILALPPVTPTRGFPSGPVETVTSGLFAGGCGGSQTSLETVPASVEMRTRTLPPETSTAPGGTGPVRVTTGGSPRSVKRCGTGNVPSPTGPRRRPRRLRRRVSR